MQKVEICGDADAAVAGEVAGALHDAAAEAVGERVHGGLEPSLTVAGLRQKVELRGRRLRRDEIVGCNPDETERAALPHLVEQRRRLCEQHGTDVRRFAKHALARSCVQVDPTDSTITGGGDGATAGSAWKTNAAGFKYFKVFE